MTAVEFYDRTSIENIISSITTMPDKIIFIGDGKVMKKFEPLYLSFIERRKLNIEVEYRNIKKNDLSDIVEVLSDIVETEEQCVFDLTGGDDLALVAMGIVFQKYPEKNIQMQRFNVNNGVVTDCDNDGTVLYTGAPTISIEENIHLHGGAVRYGDDDRTFEWDLSEDFICDIEKMWSICRRDPGFWNSRLNVLEAMESCNTQEPALNVEVNILSVQGHMKNIDSKYTPVDGLLLELQKKNLIYSYKNDGENISFSYKNDQVKKCLTKAGTVLELKVLIAANSLKSKDETAFYTDSMNGVYIDWDGNFHQKDDEEKDTENEIDVILMKGLIPIFISCKNGNVGDDELYKLETVANRFGGPYAKKVLIATYLGRKTQSRKYFKQRAQDMRINLIDSVHQLSDERFAKMVKHLINS